MSDDRVEEVMDIAAVAAEHGALIGFTDSGRTENGERVLDVLFVKAQIEPEAIVLEVYNPASDEPDLTIALARADCQEYVEQVWRDWWSSQ